jgi:hypothetical protein
MAYSLTQAAAAAGRTRSTILRAIQTGRVSAARDATTGAWAIEPAELHRVYPVADRQVLDGVDRQGDGGVDATALIAAKDALIMEQRAMIEDLRRQRDRADDERRRMQEQLAGLQTQMAALLTDQRTTVPMPTSAAVPAPVPARRSWWRWGRG